jgi:hypothetical protein
MKLTEHKTMHIKHIWDKFVMTSISVLHSYNKNYFKRSQFRHQDLKLANTTPVNYSLLHRLLIV